jgi:hypothetical protein
MLFAQLQLAFVGLLNIFAQEDTSEGAEWLDQMWDKISSDWPRTGVALLVGGVAFYFTKNLIPGFLGWLAALVAALFGIWAGWGVYNWFAEVPVPLFNLPFHLDFASLDDGWRILIPVGAAVIATGTALSQRVGGRGFSILGFIVTFVALIVVALVALAIWEWVQDQRTDAVAMLAAFVMRR